MGMVDIWQRCRTRKHGDTDKDNFGELEFDLKLSLSSSCPRALSGLCIEARLGQSGEQSDHSCSLHWNDRPIEGVLVKPMDGSQAKKLDSYYLPTKYSLGQGSADFFSKHQGVNILGFMVDYGLC